MLNNVINIVKYAKSIISHVLYLKLAYLDENSKIRHLAGMTSILIGSDTYDGVQCINLLGKVK